LEPLKKSHREGRSFSDTVFFPAKCLGHESMAELDEHMAGSHLLREGGSVSLEKLEARLAWLSHNV
jgi:hypothetical protein